LSHHRNTPAKNTKSQRTQENSNEHHPLRPLLRPADRLAGIIGGAALGLAGAASAASAANNADVRPPDVVATPDVKAHPAPQAVPGARWHEGVYQVEVLQPGYIR
jgi:hypothetical protein